MKKCSRGHFLSDSDIQKMGAFNDPHLLKFANTIEYRRNISIELENRIRQICSSSLSDFADYHIKYGMHFDKDKNQWIFSEWAPNATTMYILCDKNGWQKDEAFRVDRSENNTFARRFPKEMFNHQDLYRLKMIWSNGEGDRIPTAARRVVQDYHTNIFNAQIWQPEEKYRWQTLPFVPSNHPILIYETHVGMALEEGRIGTYREFEHHILPKIEDAGYNTIQLMAIQEHPYYGSFGYHVSNFFAPSSRFGTPDELKSLIDAAHKRGIRVLMDIIQSHAVNNEVEGLSKFDGSSYQFFHSGQRGRHYLWDSRCFDYNKLEVIGFLLSNLRYWIDEFHIDGFRFDGITSMLFEDHGIARAFKGYDDYYRDDLDCDALSYLYLANKMVHELSENSVTIAEDVSGYPGLAATNQDGGIGFDYRFAMGIADFWIKLLKDYTDEEWHLGTLWHELTTKRKEEKTISYSESHDQSLVGDKTLMMHLMGGHIYSDMKKDTDSIETFRGVALHKLIRLITIATADSGYLNFMGNEFGHPEWVDFPSERNGFSYDHARRQWSLKYDQTLLFSSLFEFDRQMIQLIKDTHLFADPKINLLVIHESDKIMAFERKNMIFVFNFHHSSSYTDYVFDAPAGEYRLILNSDRVNFGGKNRLKNDQTYFTLSDKEKYGQRNLLSLYLPTRTAVVLKKRTAQND